MGIKKAQLVLALSEEQIKDIKGAFEVLLMTREVLWNDIRFDIFPKEEQPGQIKDYNIKQNKLKERANKLRKQYDEYMNQVVITFTGLSKEDAELVRQQIICCYIERR